MNSLKRLLIIILILTVLTAVVVLSSLNAQYVHLDIYLFEFDWPLGFLLVVFLMMGFVTGLMVSLLSWIIPAKRKATRWKRQYYLAKEATKSEATKPDASTPKLSSSRAIIKDNDL